MRRKDDATVLRLINISLLVALMVMASGFKAPLASAGSSNPDCPKAPKVNPGNSSPFEEGEVIVELNDGASIDDVNHRNRTETIQQLHGTNFYRLQIPAGRSENKWRKRLANDPDVRSASLNPIISSPFIVDGRRVMAYPDGDAVLGHSEDEYRSQKRLFNPLKITEAQLHSTGSGVVVAVIDTGVDPDHPAIKDRLWQDTRPNADAPGSDNDHDGFVDDSKGWNFVCNNNQPYETADHQQTTGDQQTTFVGHGTFVAGLIALMAPDALIMPIKAFTKEGYSSVFLIAASIKFATDHGANVINLSCGSTEDSQLLRDAISYARAQGVLVFAAAGNEGVSNNPEYPASLMDDVVGVGAVDDRGIKASFSNYGPGVDVVAPGVKLISAYPGGDYALWNGTSFSTPLVAAEATLILGNDADATHTRDAIETTSLNLDELNPKFAGQLGKGQIDPLAALTSIDGGPVPDLHAEIDLRANDIEPAAQGQAGIVVRGDTQQFILFATGLHVRLTTYGVVIDGFSVKPPDGSSTTGFKTDDMGGLSLTLSTAPDDGQLQLPDALNPVTGIKTVQLVDPAGRIVLENSFDASPGRSVAQESIVKATHLKAVDGSSGTKSIARLEINGAAARLKIRADGLAPFAAYALVVDGVYVASAVTSTGFVHLDVSTDGPIGLQLPPSLLPANNIKHVELRDAGGVVALQGDFRKSLAATNLFAPPISRRTTNANGLKRRR